MLISLSVLGVVSTAAQTDAVLHLGHAHQMPPAALQTAQPVIFLFL